MSDFVRQNAVVTDFATSDSWVILSPIEQSIKRKIEAIGTPLKDWDIQINYGIKTGYNEAFIITTEKRDEILSNCADEDERKRTDELIRPILRGRDIKRYGYDWADLWLINTHNGIKGKLDRIRIEDYPAVKAHLDQYWDKISTRADKGDTPYNLRNCAYLDDFSKPKIVWKRIGSILRFSYDDRGCFGLDSTCFASGSQLAYLTCVLNSKIGHYLLKDSPCTGTGDLLISVQAIEPLMIPMAPNDSFEELLCRILSGSKDAETNAFHAISDLYGFNREEREYILMR